MPSGDIFQQEAELKQLSEDFFGSAESLTSDDRVEVLKVLVSSLAALLIDKKVITQDEFQEYTKQNMQYLLLLKQKRKAQSKQ